MALKENYKDDILDVSVNTKRKYRMTENADGTISLDDETVYTQEGDSFGASDLNAMAHAINNTSSDAEHTSYDNTTSGLVSDNVQGAIDEINDNLAQTPVTVGGETLSTIDDKLNWLIDSKINYEIIENGNNYLPYGAVWTTVRQLYNTKKYIVFLQLQGSGGDGIAVAEINEEGIINFINTTSSYIQGSGNYQAIRVDNNNLQLNNRGNTSACKLHYVIYEITL